MPRDDENGHYRCDKDGNRVCLNGYKGEDRMCVDGNFFAILKCTHISLIKCKFCVDFQLYAAPIVKELVELLALASKSCFCKMI